MNKEVSALWPDTIAGHVRASEMLRNYPGCRLVTCIRQPVDRLVSYWRFWHAQIERLRREGRPLTDVNHVRFAREQPTVEQLAEWLPSRMTEQLDVPISRFDCVLRYDHLDDDWREMLQEFGLPEIDLPRQNVTPSSIAPPEFDRARVGQILSNEIEMYHRVLSGVGSAD